MYAYRFSANGGEGRPDADVASGSSSTKISQDTIVQCTTIMWQWLQQWVGGAVNVLVQKLDIYHFMTCQGSVRGYPGKVEKT